MDATENELSDLVIDGYPTLYLFKGKDKKNPIKYSSGFDFNSLDTFIGINVASKYNEGEHTELWEHDKRNIKRKKKTSFFSYSIL